MGMRMIRLIAFFGIVLASTATAPAQDFRGSLIALRSTESPADRLYTPIPKQEDAKVAFCGQCPADENCGSGHKCCGPSNCRQCYRVVTCPR